MRQFAQKVASLLTELQQLETIAVKTASEKASSAAQKTQAEASSCLYDVIKKEASTQSGNAHDKMLILVGKMASVLGKPAMTNDTKSKLAAAVLVDQALHTRLGATQEKDKVASCILYGREHIAEILKGILA
jgi:hypothetical protein